MCRRGCQCVGEVSVSAGMKGCRRRSKYVGMNVSVSAEMKVCLKGCKCVGQFASGSLITSAVVPSG